MKLQEIITRRWVVSIVLAIIIMLFINLGRGVVLGQPTPATFVLWYAILCISFVVGGFFIVGFFKHYSIKLEYAIIAALISALVARSILAIWTIITTPWGVLDIYTLLQMLFRIFVQLLLAALFAWFGFTIGCFVFRRIKYGLNPKQVAIVLVAIFLLILSISALAAILWSGASTETKGFNNGRVSFSYNLPSRWSDDEYVLDEARRIASEARSVDPIFAMAGGSGIIFLGEANLDVNFGDLGVTLEEAALSLESTVQIEGGLEISNQGIVVRNENEWYLFDAEDVNAGVVTRYGVTPCGKYMLILMGVDIYDELDETFEYYDHILDTFECKG